MGWNNPPIPWRELEERLSWDLKVVPLQRYDESAPRPRSGEGGAVTGLDAGEPVERKFSELGDAAPWAELHCHSGYSFLDGASSPEALVAEAARLGVEVLAVTDHDGMYGVVRMAEAAAEAGIKTVFGAELSLGMGGRQTGVPDPEGTHLLVLARSIDGYGRLAGAIASAQLRGEKGRPVYDLEELARRHGGEWVILTGCRKGSVPGALAAGDPPGCSSGGPSDGPSDGMAAARDELDMLIDLFGRGNVFVELIDHDQPLDDDRNDALFELAQAAGVGVVASNNVHYARPADADLAQVLAAARARSSMDGLAGWSPATGTAHLRSGAEMKRRLARFPGAYETTLELGRSCVVDLELLAPDLPPRRLGEGHTDTSWLRHEVENGARLRYGPRGPQNRPVYDRIAHELEVIEELNFPGYFLIVHEITEFCRSEGILCQGRGSAANSAVCYALGITAVEPIANKLLFERFLSTARDGPPDIDIDIQNNRREEVIQHVYDKYGRDRAAQVANVNTFRPKMAIRDAARAFGYSPGQADAWTRQIEFRVGPDDGPRGEKTPAEPLPDSGDLPAEVADVVARMLQLPRHLSIHSGGMVLCDRPIGEVCPIEWATMPGRSVLQWDKDDCAAVGLVKFDLLGLGMLSALSDSFAQLCEHHGRELELQTIPAEDPRVYDMLCDADTVGVFQVESRAQMATLPRLKPRRFYQLVVEVALIRPGPIQGGSVHPYIRRSNKDEEVTYPHELMRPALERTLGIPLFQEQMMQLAIDCAGFTAKESDELRQAMSSKRSPERIERLHERLLTGMAEKGIPMDVAEDIYAKLHGFASYGFPESHAYSFAYLVYASSWFKRYYPAVFTAALLNNQPMGFYTPQTLIADARRHGVEVRGVDVNASAVKATLEEPVPVNSDHPHAPDEPQPAIRLGLAGVRNLGDDVAEAITAGRPYAGLSDLVRRVRIPLAALEALATAGAFGCFGLERREALWAVGALAGTGPGQIDGTTPGVASPSLPAMTAVEQTIADLWATGTSADSHPVQHVRDQLDEWGALAAAGLAAVPHGRRVLVGGLVTHRQRPPTAGGVVFMNLEDETGMVNVVCPRGTWERQRRIALDSSALLIDGRIERAEGATNLVAQRLRPLRVSGNVRSRDFR